MGNASQTLAALRHAISHLEERQKNQAFASDCVDQPLAISTGCELVDQHLTAVGPGELHEIRCAHTRDIGAAASFLCTLLIRLEAQKNQLFQRPVVWIADPSTRLDGGQLWPDGLAQLGLKPERFVFVHPTDIKSAIWAAGEAARQGNVSAVVLQVSGNPRVLDLAVSRKLMLRAQAGKTPLFLLRQAGEQEASSATIRFCVEVENSISNQIVSHGIGSMRHHLTLEKNRNGQTGNWLLSWNPEQRAFEHAAYPISPTHSGTSLHPSADRPDCPEPLGQVMAFDRAS